MIIAPFLLHQVTSQKPNYALSLPCDWYLSIKENGVVYDRLWWPTATDVRIYFIPVLRNGMPNFPPQDVESSWIDSSKLPSKNFMTDPSNKGGTYGFRYMYFEMQIRELKGTYFLLTGTLYLSHWHRVYPDPLTVAQVATVRKTHRITWFEANEEKHQLSCIFLPSGQSDDDPMLADLQFPAMPAKEAQQVKDAFMTLTVVPQNFRIPPQYHKH